VNKEMQTKMKEIIALVKEMPEVEQIEAINWLKTRLSKVNPIKEPVDNVQWIPCEDVQANEYNPNRVAPPEMELLRLSIDHDGYTQPIVAYYDDEENKYIVVDGFHRNRIGKEDFNINQRIKDHLPIVVINKPIDERMASTIRHNRARGTHQIKPMSKVVEELYFAGWSNKRIAKELGMEKDEVLRLKQFTGIGALFAEREFSKSWI
jgi:ParB-like chromosome segregation protein Spo0J